MAVLRDNPYPAFNFLVDLGTGEPAAFSEVSGLGLVIAYLEYRAGSDKRNHVRKMPGLHKVGDVTLKRGVVGSLDLFEWIRTVRDGGLDRRTVVITLLDEAHTPVMQWKLYNAWPKKLEGPALNASANEVAIESLTLTCEGIEIE
jgi:phage tail-like protein